MSAEKNARNIEPHSIKAIVIENDFPPANNDFLNRILKPNKNMRKQRPIEVTPNRL